MAGRFYMDIDILSRLYKDMAKQQCFMGDFPRSEQHRMPKAWSKAYDKFVDEMIEKIGQQYFC